MKNLNKEILFGANNSEFKGGEYTIPEGFEAEIKDGKIIVREKESEDDRIRKELLEFLDETYHLGKNTNFDRWDKSDCANWIAYLEKQKEQKPAELERLAKLREMTHEIREAYERGIEVGRAESKQEWSEADEKMRQHIISDLREFKDCETDKDLISDYEDEIAWLKSLRPQPKQKWSEEDENYYDTIVRKLQVIGDDSGLTLNQIDFLDKHRPQPHWKPSEEQMIALYKAAQESPIIKENGNYLYDLYDDLRKLM